MKLTGIVMGGLALTLASTGASLAQQPPVLPAAEMTMETTVVTATGWESRIAETAPAITVIRGEDLERRKILTVADALREVPGLTVAESGSRGGETSVFMRGAQSDQVLVLIDGIEVNSTTVGSFDFSNLTTENLDRIEILRGAGGTLYGSEAIGGVIQIFTRKGSGAPRGSISASGGNGSTDREVADFSGQSGIFGYSGSASHIHTDGFQSENDDYENTVVSARVDAEVAENAAARVALRAGASEFGNAFSNNFLAAPDPDARIEDGVLAARGEWSHALASALRYRLAVSYSRDDLEFRDRPDAAETSSTDSDILSQVLAVDGLSNLSWWQGRGESIFGIEHESKAGDVDSEFFDPSFGSFPTKFERTLHNVAGYTLQQLFLDERRLVASGGVRVDDNSRFGTEVSPSAGLSYTVAATRTRLRATYAEGFKAPSLNELFFPGFGNPDLDAETSREVGGGFDQWLWGEAVVLSASGFHRELEGLIEGVPQESGLFRAENIGDATIDGAEAALGVEILPGLRGGGEYTFLDIDADANARVRRPRHGGSVHLAARIEELWRSGDLVTVDVRLLLVGSRDDFDPAAFFAVRENPAYQRADLSAAYSFPAALPAIERLEVFARVENLFDRDYDEVLGFPARPVNFLAGLRAEL